jgi:hypothetical protein
MQSLITFSKPRISVKRPSSHRDTFECLLKHVLIKPDLIEKWRND